MKPSSSLPVPPPRDVACTVLRQEEIASRSFRIRLHAPFVSSHVAPGQFVQVRVSGNSDPFLRRPFSVSNADAAGEWIELVYRVVGKGSAALAGCGVGDSLQVLGPLGHPFRLPTSGRVLLVGGGIGLPPVFFAAMRVQHCTPVLVQGAQTSDLLLFVREAAEVRIEHRWVTEDGTPGQRGLVTDVLTDILTDLDSPPVEILACGPPAMLAAVARMAVQNAIPCQVSLEERMACGFGICMGCAVEQVTPGTSERDFALVCVDGPVFDAPTVFPQSE